MAIVAGLVSVGLTTPAYAQTVYPDPSGQKQCATDDINDSNGVVGTCTPASVSGPAVATYAATPGTTPTVLQALVSGQDCGATGLADSNIIIGSCLDANNRPFGVIWTSPTHAPTVLSPLPALKGALTQLIADVTSTATAYNPNGAVVGESTSGGGVDTAVLWPAGTGSGSSMIVVSTYGDNCQAVDVNAALIHGLPSVALDCPLIPTGSNPGPMIGKIAENNALHGGYALYPLELPAGATYCTASAINDALQVMGTCHFTAPDDPQTAFWTSPTSAPVLLVVSGSARNGGAAMNSSGNIAFDYQDSSGKGQAGFWNTSSHTVTLISDLSGGSRCSVAGLGDNDTVTLNCENANEQNEAAKWTSTAGITDLGDLNNGDDSAVTATNKGGTAAALAGEDVNQNELGGEESL